MTSSSFMDPWDHHRLRHPSFSSTLLDHIYRSIDDSSDLSMRKTKLHRDDNNTHHHRPIPNKTLQQPHFFNYSTSTSSDSSGFSSSESDSFYRRSKSSPRISLPNPIRTTVEQQQPHREHHGSFLKTKSKALKIYTDLKKVKQPISPGGRLATFLNSIFTGTGNTKKPTKTTTTTTVTTPSTTVTTPSTTTCSSASSFSRSCLSKTPSSSTEKSKRSVRFCPVNVIFDEAKHYGHHNNSNNNKSSRHQQNMDTLEIRVMEENRRVIEAAKELLRTYKKKNKDVVDISVEEEDDDDDDAVSCSSSDLFELDNLSAIGIERYQEELPVYETTRFNTNHIISR